MRLLSLLLGLHLCGCSCGDPTLRPGADGSVGGDASSLDGAAVDGGFLPVDVVLLGPGAPADAAARFAAPEVVDPARAVTIAYPLDGVLMPRNLFSPHVQWAPRGQEGDLYRARFSGPAGTLTAYLGHTGAGFEHAYLVDYPAWRTFADRSNGTSLTLEVDRLDTTAGEVIPSAPITVRIARAGIAGAVYYWALGSFEGTEGRILRVRQGTETAPVIENFLPQPPPGEEGDRCAACHGLARDGNRMAIAFDDGRFGGVVDLTEDLTGANPPLEFRFDRPWFYAAFNPDGSRLFMTDDAQNAFLLDGHTGVEITPTGGSLGGGTHAAWSPNGSLLALIGGADDAWNPTTGNLAAIPITGDNLGARTRLHTGADLGGAPEGGSLDAYPTFSPDSRFIAFQHGTRTLASAGDARGALYVIAAEGGAPVRLDHASEGMTSYYPSFTPFETAGDGVGTVYWLLYYSRRDYGNSLAGTAGSGRRQIWVTAVSTEPGAGGDPSNVPYWLPGQDVEQENASAYWAPIPCRTTGQSCSGGGQCCSGRCGASAGSMLCEPPQECRREGETCSASSDCCDSTLACAGGVCVEAPF